MTFTTESDTYEFVDGELAGTNLPAGPHPATLIGEITVGDSAHFEVLIGSRVRNLYTTPVVSIEE